MRLKFSYTVNSFREYLLQGGNYAEEHTINSFGHGIVFNIIFYYDHRT